MAMLNNQRVSEMWNIHLIPIVYPYYHIIPIEYQYFFWGVPSYIYYSSLTIGRGATLEEPGRPWLRSDRWRVQRAKKKTDGTRGSRSWWFNCADLYRFISSYIDLYLFISIYIDLYRFLIFFEYGKPKKRSPRFVMVKLGRPLMGWWK